MGPTDIHLTKCECLAYPDQTYLNQRILSGQGFEKGRIQVDSGARAEFPEMVDQGYDHRGVAAAIIAWPQSMSPIRMT